MILTMDIGNTNIKAGVFQGEELKGYWRVSTNTMYTSDEYGILLSNLFINSGMNRADIKGIMVSSVVPTINFTIEHMCQDYFKQDPRFLVPGMKTGINIKYENPRELGSDRIANAVAVHEIYGGPCIFIDFGTATTYGVLSEKGEFLGGAIALGLKLSADALVNRTAKLPRIELVTPHNVISRTTVSNIQSGIIYGYIGSVESIVRGMKREINAPDARVIATGGMAHMVASESDVLDEIDTMLTIKGLRMIYLRNQME